MRYFIKMWKKKKNQRRNDYENKILKILTSKQELTVERILNSLKSAVDKANLYNSTFNWCAGRESRPIIISVTKLDGIGHVISLEKPADTDPYSDSYSNKRVSIISLMIDVSNIGKELSVNYFLDTIYDEWPINEIKRCERMLSTMISIYKTHV